MNRPSLPAILLASLLTLPANAEIAYVSPGFQFSEPLRASSVTMGERPLPIPIVSWAADAVTIQAHDGTLANRRSSLAKAMNAEVELQLVDDFDQQVMDYVQGHTPFLRGSLGQITLAANAVTRLGPDLKPVVFLLVSWSVGADGLCLRDAGNLAKLKNRPIVLQGKGRHLDLLPELLTRGGLNPGDLRLRYVGQSTFHPAAAMDGRCHDPLGALTEDRSVAAAIGFAHDISNSIAKPAFTTKDAPRAIADVYAVRSDFLNRHRDIVQGFATAHAREQMAFPGQLEADFGIEKTAQTMAGLFLNDEDAHEDFVQWVRKVEFPGFEGNRDFFANRDTGFRKLSQTLQRFLAQSGLIESIASLQHANLEFPAT